MDTGETPSFGELLRRYRKVAELTQEELAERAHLSVRGISDLERGARRAPRSDTLALLIDALGLVGSGRAELEAAARSADEPSGPQRTATSLLQPGRPMGTPLVGRVHERIVLERHLSGDGPPALFLAGEPGIGKTRLLKDAMDLGGRIGLRVLTGTCHRFGDQIPYAPLLQALQSYLRGQTTARLRQELQGCSWLVRLLPELTDGPIEPVPDWHLSPDQERRLMGQAVERFLVNIAGPAGTLLVLDDLQWAGSDALALLTGLVRSTPGDRFRILGAYRETEIGANDALGVVLADLAQAGLATQRRLGPLSPEEAAELLGQLLSDRADGSAGDAQVQERVLSRAEGVPFFLVSCAQALREGALEDEVPWDVSQGVRQRVAALPSTAQEVLHVASVAGHIVPRALLLRVVARPEEEVVLALESACRSGLLGERGEHDYQITHDVIREVVAADLGTARRTSLHRQIALALTAAPGEPSVEAVAYHFAHTQEHAEAARWLERAGDEARARFATAFAMEQYQAARERAVRVGLSASELSRLDEKLGDLYVLAGEFSRARESYSSALIPERSGIAESHGDTAARRAELRRKEGDAWERQGDYARALAALNAAEAEGKIDGTGSGLPNLVRASVELSRGLVYHRQGNYDAAEAAANRAGELLKAQSPTRPVAAAQARALNLLGTVAVHRGDLIRADTLFQQSLLIRERIGDQQESASSLNNLGHIAFRRSDLARAEEYFQRALDAHERIGNRQGTAGGWHNVGAAARDRGDLARAEACYLRCLTISERIGDLKLQEHAWHSLGIVAHDRGDLARADECFERSLALADAIGDVHTSAHTWHQWGMVACDRGDLSRADERVQRGLALFERLGDEHGRADCWTTLGVVAGERGDLTLSAWRCRAASRLAHRLGLTQIDTRATLGRAQARIRAGRIAVATRLLDRAQDIATACSLRLESTQAALLRSELELRGIALGQGTLAAAESWAREGLGLASQGGYRREEALARRLLGRCACMRAMPDDAVMHLRIALEIQNDMGAVLEAAHTQLDLADVLASGAEQGRIPQETFKLLAGARESFLAAGAKLDLVEAKQMAAGWERRRRA